jgi:hypothetical protein
MDAIFTGSVLGLHEAAVSIRRSFMGMARRRRRKRAAIT